MAYNDYIQRGSGPTYSATPGTHPLIPEDVQKEIVKGITHKSAVLSLFKTRRLSRAQQRVPVLDTKPVANFTQAETALKQTTAMMWRNVFLEVAEIACIVPIPEQLLDDVDYDLWEEVQPEIEEAFAVTLDEAILFGRGKPAVWPTAIGPAAIAAGNTVTQGAGIDVAADLNSAMMAVEADGYDPNGWAIQTVLKGQLRGLRDTANNFIYQPNMPGLQNTAFRGQIFNENAFVLAHGVFEAEDAAAANHVKAFVGDWKQGIIGIRQDLTMKYLDQGVIQDNTGEIIFNLPQQDMVAMRFVARYAWADPNPVNRMNTSNSTRYPWAVLRNTT
jgi:HK97 family phage major capsid protein